ncbi:tRNA (adenosine(37)-N6)-threonylcarbamoyltransferase complex dimerization subunit type 1 TsaB [Cohnella sp. CFH 77786]|uniref:tRNA (adenosine(37)-N6)-threonylcarbamoyltransferase complex dimerization subunit type 1 TsaB n=1 Tax=Cohnella sp. CFH 77786 TaxID=2662265 RepID=UPI001C608AD9|nr:tRNA (adenosine(37)-N6)-threonylcarbamoyltransferase complex dimerization subunit type 1 TsaB [Cohnella sp. CFH 77786]MBW5448315.1 tRNA (adenosine(37)-N6)-threonylcarbamoyltransferase complex dimerization subunit type 1 TsaB [Cohnella sp. CFH 77786]
MTNGTTQQPSGPVTALAFDTSTATLAAAVVRDGTVLGSVQSNAERNHSVLIVPEIKRLLAECGLTPKDLDAIAAGRGPGSYTGVRIAVSVGKTLAWAWNKPLLGISSLEALALGAWESPEPAGEGTEASAARSAGIVWIVPVMDARRGQVYTARFAADEEGGWTRLDADGIRMAGDWAEALRQEAAKDGNVSAIRFVGETAPHEALYLAGPAGGAEVQSIPCAMEAGAVGKLAVSRFRRGERDEVHAFVPNYTQMAEAEAKLLAAARRD